MANRWLARAAVASLIGAAAALGAASVAAWADPPPATNHPDINTGNVPTYAKDFKQQCDQQIGVSDTEDGWLFVLPGTYSDSGDFITLTAKFSTDADDSTIEQTVNVPSDGTFLNGGSATSKAIIHTAPGWKLITASATITGTASFFNLSHTCAAGGESTPTPGPTTPPATTKPPRTTTDPGTTTVPVTTTSHGGDGGLPVTGTAVGGLVLAGLALIGGGTALMVMRRRRDAVDSSTAGSS
jgi:LPXTG-motif cell wall-anchored protein